MTYSELYLLLAMRRGRRRPSLSANLHETHAPGTQLEDAGKPTSRQDVLHFVEKEKGWSLYDWAQHSGVDWHTVNNYVTGKSKPYTSTRKKLAQALGKPTEWLPE